MGILGKEAVSRVYCFDVGYFSRADNGGYIEVTGTGCGSAYANRLIGETDVQGIPVSFGINGDSTNAQFAAGTYDPEGDLAPVGNEYLGEHL
jgi:hypothetical protein